jgi:hypothetical protein
MNADDLKKLTTDSLDRLAGLLDAGHSDQLAALLKAMARFHRYSFNNVCLIASQCPTATRVAGFNAWRSLNRFVRKGEKGIVILAPVVRRRADDSDDDSKHIAGFRAAYVFDVAQTDGEPLPSVAVASGDPGHLTAALRSAITACGTEIEDVDNLGGALGPSSGGRIQIVKGLQAAEEFVVLVHAFAHELLHRRPTARHRLTRVSSRPRPWRSSSAKQPAYRLARRRGTTSSRIVAIATGCWRHSIASAAQRPRS